MNSATGRARGSAELIAIAVTLVVAVVVAVVFFGLRPADDAPGGAAKRAAPRDEPSPPPLRSVDVPPRAERPEEELPLRLPTGERVANLNGVTEVVDFSWPNKPYAPIVTTEIGTDGNEYYVHEDGTRSTTMYTNVNGKRTAVGFSASPTSPVPLDPGLLDRMYEQGAFGGR